MASGYNVQLKHDKKETSWEKHGCVSVQSARGELARCEDYQHNRQYNKRDALTKDLLKKVKAALEAEASTDDVGEARRPSLMERLAGMLLRRTSDPKPKGAAAAA